MHYIFHTILSHNFVRFGLKKTFLKKEFLPIRNPLKPDNKENKYLQNYQNYYQNYHISEILEK